MGKNIGHSIRRPVMKLLCDLPPWTLLKLQGTPNGMPGQKGFAAGTHRARLGSAKVVPTLSPVPLLRGPPPLP